MTAQRKYKAYTLVEMLVVLGIFIIIGGIGFSAFYGLRDSISMNEKILSITQDIRFAQRSALFLERGANDKWVYGVGIDFSTVETDGEYKIFKWCSQFSDYGDPKSKGDFPNFDKTFTVSATNGNLPITGYASNCQSVTGTTELSLLPNSGDRSILGFTVDLPNSNDASGDVGAYPRYLLFEAVSGRAFFYDNNGNIVNFGSSGLIVGTPINFKLNISSNRTKTLKSINISNISGKVDVQTSTLP